MLQYNREEAGLEGRGMGGWFSRQSLACYSRLPIIRVAGLHHAGHLYMIWLLMCSVTAPFRLSAACLHYVEGALASPAQVRNVTCDHPN